MTEELLSCPFCGSTDIEMFYNRSGVDHYTCQYCGASAKDWNSRHESDDVCRLRNLLEDVVNALDLSDAAIEMHGPLGTEPAELVRLVLGQKDLEIACLKAKFESDELPEWLVERIQQIRSNVRNRKYGEWVYKFISDSEQFKIINTEIDAYLGYILSLRRGEE